MQLLLLLFSFFQQQPGYNGGVRIPEDYLKIPNGGRVEIRCQVFGPDDSQIYLDWKRSDRRPLPEGSTVHRGVLTIPKVTKDAAGEYVCLGLNHAGFELFRAKSHLDVVCEYTSYPPNKKDRGSTKKHLFDRYFDTTPFFIFFYLISVILNF